MSVKHTLEISLATLGMGLNHYCIIEYDSTWLKVLLLVWKLVNQLLSDLRAGLSLSSSHLQLGESKKEYYFAFSFAITATNQLQWGF